jgi:Gpi18-like mannosyltransferase
MEKWTSKQKSFPQILNISAMPLNPASFLVQVVLIGTVPNIHEQSHSTFSSAHSITLIVLRKVYLSAIKTNVTQE